MIWKDRLPPTDVWLHMKPQWQPYRCPVFVNDMNVALLPLKSVDQVCGHIAVAGTSHPCVLAPDVCSESCGNGAIGGA